MKVQSLAVIFAIIILPIIIILTYFINYEIDTIEQQNKYDTMLIDSTYDAMAAFELNTANEDLSAVADSLRSIIDASTNVFFNTLATNLGISNANVDYVRTYVPAILYTLYDGYYIYSPTRVPTILTTSDEKIVYVGDGGVSIADSSSVPVKYRFNEASYSAGTNEAIYSSLPASRKFEYGQMLYENNDGTYSTQLNANTKYKQDYILKSFMPYSSRYLENPADPSGSSYDITINYTLDNYLTVEGEIGDVYYSKTGYLIAKDTVTSVTLDGSTSDLLTYNEDTAEEIILSGEHSVGIVINPYIEDGINRVASPIAIDYTPYIDPDTGAVLSANEMQEKVNKIYDDLETLDKNAAKETDPANRAALEADGNNLRTGLQDLEFNLANLKAITYYIKAQIFSNWVYTTLGNDGGLAIQARNIATDIAELNEGIYTSTNTDDITAIFHDFEGDNTVIFNSSQNPEKGDSSFFSHKLNVIKNSIQYNLNLALSSYDIMAGKIDVQMPVMTQDEWDKILTNVSITTFLQGLNCGLKKYNDYAIVSSTNSELTVIPDEIYYVRKSEFNNPNSTEYYHRIDCDELVDGEDYISFTSKEIKYDKIYDKNSQFYRYDHRNNGCYTCIVNSNYEKDINSAHERGYSNSVIMSALTPAKQRAYYTAVAKERQNLYKTNALTSSNGYETLYMSSTATPLPMTFETPKSITISKDSTLGMKDVKELELTISNVSVTDPAAAGSVATATFEIVLNGVSLGEYTINVGQSTPQTIIAPVHINSDVKITGASIVLRKTTSDDIKASILGIRAIYE